MVGAVTAQQLCLYAAKQLQVRPAVTTLTPLKFAVALACMTPVNPAVVTCLV
jgi:hypothetical protein